MPHDEQWNAIFEQLWERISPLTGTNADFERQIAQIQSANGAYKAGENPILWKLANG